MVTGEPDMDRVFQLPPTTYIGGDKSALTLRDIINRLEVKKITYQNLPTYPFPLVSIFMHMYPISIIA